jgi:hypothetical protein
VSVLVQLLMAAAVVLAEPQSPPTPSQTQIAPVRIEPAIGGGNPIVVTLTGAEQDPAPLAATWNTSNECLSDVACFVSSWLEANASGSMDHLLAVRAPEERATLQRRLTDPQVIARNTSRFNTIRRWSLLGWAEYGPVRIVFLVKEDDTPNRIYTLPIKHVEGGRWAQTDVLASDPGYSEIFDRIGLAILNRHRR